MDSIKNRRSIRKYKQDEIPASLLNVLFDTHTESVYEDEVDKIY